MKGKNFDDLKEPKKQFAIDKSASILHTTRAGTTQPKNQPSSGFMSKFNCMGNKTKVDSSDTTVVSNMKSLAMLSRYDD